MLKMICIKKRVASCSGGGWMVLVARSPPQRIIWIEGIRYYFLKPCLVDPEAMA